MARRTLIRAADADREHVADRLRQATAEGRLQADELEERLEAAFSARTYGELEELTRDLPGEAAPRARPSIPIAWPAAVIAFMFLMPIVVALMVAAVVLVASTVAFLGPFVALAVLWMVGHRRRFVGPPYYRHCRRYRQTSSRYYSRSWHPSASRWRA
jgi:hypothetical protein